MFFRGTLLRTITQDTVCQITLRNYSKEVREESRYIEIFAENKTKAHVIKHKKITTNHKSQASQVNVFVLFSVWEDMRVWGS